jgi:hypothetical protein
VKTRASVEPGGAFSSRGKGTTRALAWVRAGMDVSTATIRSVGDRAAFADVERFCLFIGYPRSGHSLVGSLLDAHPDMVIAHELDFLRYLRLPLFRRAQLFELIAMRERWFNETGRNWTGFRYQVPGQWQGRVRTLRVIGDKKGGRSTIRLMRRPELLDRLARVVAMDLAAIHVVRNPFDNIATMHLRGGGPLSACADTYFSMAAGNGALRDRSDIAVFDLRYEHLIREPARALDRLCRFLGVDASPGYLDACAMSVSREPHQSRHEVVWPQPLVRTIEERSESVDFLRGYGFDA